MRRGYRRVIRPPRQEEYYCRSNFILNIQYSVMGAYLFPGVVWNDCSLFVRGAEARKRRTAERLELGRASFLAVVHAPADFGVGGCSVKKEAKKWASEGAHTYVINFL